MKTYECRFCLSVVEPAYGADEPAAHMGGAGDKASPRSPGDHKRCCDACCYGERRCEKEAK